MTLTKGGLSQDQQTCLKLTFTFWICGCMSVVCSTVGCICELSSTIVESFSGSCSNVGCLNELSLSFSASCSTVDCFSEPSSTFVEDCSASLLLVSLGLGLSEMDFRRQIGLYLCLILSYDIYLGRTFLFL